MFALALLAWPIKVAVAAEDEPAYTVISLAADFLQIIEKRPVTGAAVGGTQKSIFDARSTNLDKQAVLAVEAALHRDVPNATVTLLAPTDELYRLQSSWLTSGARAEELVQKLKPLLPSDSAKRILILAKNRCAAKFEVGDRQFGEGHVDGLGFYSDPSVALKEPTSERVYVGVVAAFACMQLISGDLATGKGEAWPIWANSVRLNEGATPNFWNALSGQEKFGILKGLLDGPVAEAAAKAAH